MKVSDIQVTLIDHMGSDLSVVNAARVSFHKESNWEYSHWDGETYKQISDKDEKLINYLAKHKHFSPFNHSFITMRVKAPIFVARQLVKHRFMPWNEVSRRYVDEEPEFYYPGYSQFRLKADNVKQGSSEELTDEPSIVLSYQQDSWYSNDEFDFEDMCDAALKYYQAMLHKGICAEQARMILPQNMMTEWIWSGTLGAWCDMLRLRLDPHTQYESRIVAQKARALIEPIFPISVKALLDV